MYITITEFYTVKISALDNAIYNNIVEKFARLMAYDKAIALLEKHYHKTLATLDCNIVDLADCYKLIY